MSMFFAVVALALASEPAIVTIDELESEIVQLERELAYLVDDAHAHESELVAVEEELDAADARLVELEDEIWAAEPPEEKEKCYLLPDAPAGYGGPGVINPYTHVDPLNPATDMQSSNDASEQAKCEGPEPATRVSSAP